MVKREPVAPIRPEENDEAKFELVKAMGVAIAAIAKEKSVFITTAEVNRNTDDFWELDIKCVVPKDKETGVKYNEQMRKYYADKREWEIEKLMETLNISRETYNETEQEYNIYCRNTEYGNRISKEEFFKSHTKLDIIEVL